MFQIIQGYSIILLFICVEWNLCNILGYLMKLLFSTVV